MARPPDFVCALHPMLRRGAKPKPVALVGEYPLCGPCVRRLAEIAHDAGATIDELTWLPRHTDGRLDLVAISIPETR